jgi:hypothetical protein
MSPRAWFYSLLFSAVLWAVIILAITAVVA